MKRLLSLVLIACSTVSLTAEKKTIKIDPIPKKDTGKTIHRAPMKLPIDVVFDNETMTVEVSCTNDLEGEVFLYNSSEELEDYSPCLNSILSVTNSDFHTILIEGDGWSASGVIE